MCWLPQVATRVQLWGLVAPYVQLWLEFHLMCNLGCIFHVLDARVAPHVQRGGLVAPYVQPWPELCVTRG